MTGHSSPLSPMANPISASPLYEQIIAMKTWQATQDLFKCNVPMKSPCVKQSSEWFALHKYTIIKATDDAYGKNPALPSIQSFTPAIKTILFDKVQKGYQQVAESGELFMDVTQGCCNNIQHCSFTNYQRLLLQSMRAHANNKG